MSVHAKIDGHTLTIAMWQAIYRGKPCMRGSVALTKRAERACGFHHAHFKDRTDVERAAWERVKTGLDRWARANVGTLEVYSGHYLIHSVDATTNGGAL